MNRLITTLAVMLSAFCASTAYAQHYYVDAENSQMLRFGDFHGSVRKEILLPGQVAGFNVYKADLHTHTIYSDGSVTPEFRMKEAWLEGLDIIAITDHIEWRPAEKEFGAYLKVEGTVETDLNTSVRLAQKEAEYWDLFLIPGTEITRDGTDVGHFNALFTVDNNKIYDPDPVQAIRNAKAQGALVMHNHPGWWRTSIDFTETEKAAYGEGLIDGVEVMNDTEFYPGIIDRVREHGLFISSNTDIHGSTAEYFNAREFMRPITLILASERTEKGIREALEADRTLGFGFNTLCGSEQLLVEFFKASISVQKLSGTAYMLTNNSCVPYILQSEGANPMHLDPFCTLRLDGPSKFHVMNMFCGKDQHPVVDLSL